MPSPTDPAPGRPAVQSRAPAQARTGAGGGDPDETSDQSAATSSGVAVAFGPPAGPNEVGTLGPYRVVKPLGKGGMGAVFLAFDTRLKRKLALKVMLPQFAADRAARERFLREARAAAQIAHDNVVTVYEADERDGVPYIAMQFLQGYPLDEYLKKKGDPGVPQIIRLGREAAAGLAAAHKIGLIHRDIKPANLWLEAPNGRVKVLDFGLAKPVNTDVELTGSGLIVGTPAYMSPEQARGLKVDGRSDLFSLGAVLYRLCTGRLPFEGPTAMAVLTALAADEPRPVRELNPAVPAALADLIHQLLSKNPAGRPATADEMVRRLRAIATDLAVPTAGVAGGSPGGSGALTVTAVPETDPFADLDLTVTEPTPLPSAVPRAKPGSSQRWVWGAVASAVAAVVVVAGVIIATRRGGEAKNESSNLSSDGVSRATRDKTAKPSTLVPPAGKPPARQEPVKPDGRSAALEREAQVTGELRQGGLTEAELDVKVAAGEELTAQLETTRENNSNCAVDLIRPRLEGPAGTLDLSNVRRLSEATGWGRIRRGRDNEDKDIAYQGRPVLESLWFHAPGHLTWAVPSGYDRFRATVVCRAPASGFRVRVVLRR